MKTALLANTTPTVTREGWLQSATLALGEHFFPILDGAHKLPNKMACSCGFPYGISKAIGQCFSPEASADGVTNIFVCPTQDEPVRVLDILLHELGHAALGIEEKHGKRFKMFCKEVGLEGKATATIAEPGTELHSTLTKIAERLGPYPHRAMVKSVAKGKKKGGGGWVRLQSTTEEDYKVTISPKQLEVNGYPIDPWGKPMQEVET